MFFLGGKCPIPKVAPECPDTPESLCSVDQECEGDQKCCVDGCDAFRCTDPGKCLKIFAKDKINNGMSVRKHVNEPYRKGSIGAYCKLSNHGAYFFRRVDTFSIQLC